MRRKKKLKMSWLRIKIVACFFIVSLAAMAADLPSKGKNPPAVVKGPGAHPVDPGAPIGSGLGILLGLSATYILIKKKKQ